MIDSDSSASPSQMATLSPLPRTLTAPPSDVMWVFLCVFPYEEEEDLQPVVVQVVWALPPVQADQPPAARGVPGVLPVWEDARLEQGVVRAGDEPAGHLDVVVQTPEVLDGVHSHHLPLILLPGTTFVVLKEPESPGILKGMLYDFFWTNWRWRLGLGHDFCLRFRAGFHLYHGDSWLGGCQEGNDDSSDEVRQENSSLPPKCLFNRSRRDLIGNYWSL